MADPRRDSWSQDTGWRGLIYALFWGAVALLVLTPRIIIMYVLPLLLALIALVWLGMWLLPSGA